MNASPRATVLALLPLLLVMAGCAGSRTPKTVGEQRDARAHFEEIRQAYFDTADIPAARAAMADLMDDWLGHVPEEVFTFQDRLDRVQELEMAADAYAGPMDDAACAGELARLRGDMTRAAALVSTSQGAEKVTLNRVRRRLGDAEARLQACVVRLARDYGEEDRLLATSRDPAVLRPLVDARDAELAAGGTLDEILRYLRLSRGLRHSPAIIDRTDELLLGVSDRDLIAGYLFYYADHSHDDALFHHLDRLFLASEDWVAMEAYLQRFPTRPHAAALETKLQDYYRREFETGARLFDQEKFAEAVGHLAAVAPRSPQFGPARSLLHEAANMGYYRWEQPDIWLLVPPYRW